MSKILIVEDDQTIALGIEYSLKQEGFHTEVAHDMSSAKEILQTSEFHLVLLDVSLPDGNGFDLCRMIRKQGDTPVIFLTVRDEEVNVVMTKPFRVRELISRIKSVLRRYEKQPPQKTEIRLGEVLIDTAQARVFKQGKEILLTALEYRLLLTLANHAGQVLTRKQILEHIWDVAGDFVNDNTLTVYIKRLREKIEDDPHQPKLIQTVRGLGYKAGVGFETD